MGFETPSQGAVRIQDTEPEELVNVIVYDWKRSEQWRFLAIVSLLTFLGPLMSALLLPALDTITEEFDAQTYEISLMVSITLLPMALLTVVWGPLSERFGRRPMYLIISLSMCVFFYLTAISWSIWILIVGRFVMGIPFAGLFVLGYGVLSDTYPPEHRAKAAVCA
jgi:MFS transporter, DHA1 family, multidrug resistance protein